MIKLTETIENFYDFCKDNPFGTRIAALYLTYGSDCRFADFWYQQIDNNITAAIAKVSGDITLCICNNTDFQELNEFLNVIGYQSLTYNSDFSEKLCITPSDGGLIVEFSDTPVQYDAPIKNYAELSEVYDLISSQGVGFLTDKLSWIADISYRLKHNTAKLGVIFEENRLAACAMILFETPDNAFLGAVATYPQYRGKGYSRKILHYLLKNNKKSFLFCRENGIISFYREVGFKPIGKFSVEYHNEQLF